MIATASRPAMLGDPLMAPPEEKRRGFCPGVWAPMLAGDGLLVRVHVRSGRLSAAELRGLATAARRWGNGVVELTRRTNLQIRGASAQSLPSLQAELLRLGLAEASRDRETRPALLVCPLSGLDARSARLEAMAEVLNGVLSSRHLPRLSEKFLVVLSGGSNLFDGLGADVRLELRDSEPGRVQLSLGGSAEDAWLLGSCAQADVARVLETLLAVLAETASERLRLGQLLARGGAERLGAALGRLCRAASEPEPTWHAAPLGYHSGLVDWFGLELPFGSASPGDLDTIADVCERFGSGEVRVAPQRMLLLPGVRPACRRALGELFRQRHFIVERPAPALRLVACSGAPACRSAHAETRQLATELGELLRGELRADATLHVSGCEKGCAWDGPADITLVHGADGVRLGFGQDVAGTGAAPALSLAAVRERLSAAFRTATFEGGRARGLGS